MLGVKDKELSIPHQMKPDQIMKMAADLAWQQNAVLPQIQRQRQTAADRMDTMNRSYSRAHGGHRSSPGGGGGGEGGSLLRYWWSSWCGVRWSQWKKPAAITQVLGASIITEVVASAPGVGVTSKLTVFSAVYQTQ